jgi:adenylate cyclase
MSIRTKFFALAGVLLALFGAVVGVLAWLQRDSADNLADIIEYHIPLTRLLADVDVATFEYELEVERLRRRTDWTPEERAAQLRRIDEVAQRIRTDFERVRNGVEAAIGHNTDDPRDLVGLARIQGAMKYLYRQVEPFLGVGKAVGQATIAGDTGEAHHIALGFGKFEDAFGPDLAEIRAELNQLTDKATAAIAGNARLNAYLSFALFLVASGVGLAISGIGSGRVVSALRSLLASTRALEGGRLDVQAPVVTHDEVGELARAFNRMVVELKQRERIKETFGKFVDPRIVSRLIGGPDGDASDQAERKTATIFFSDIKGFSGISEQLTAAAMVNLLNSYFAAVAEVIHAHRGIIDKYIGDAVMAFWTPPFSTGDDHAADACLAALRQQAALAELRLRLPEITGLRRDAPELLVRMGIATGEVVVGAIGSPSSRSYTVIGDTVNLASRLEGVNKVYGTAITIAEDTFRLARNAIEAREIDIVTVAGKTEPIRIYEVMAEAGALDPARAELRDRFAAALAAYRAQDWPEAEDRLAECLRLCPEDRPSAVYLDRLTQLRLDPPDEAWDGVWRLKAK